MQEKPTYSNHARLRMTQRRVSESEVEAVLAEYHTRYHDRDGNDILIAHPGGRRIKVVVAKNSDPARVITVGD